MATAYLFAPDFADDIDRGRTSRVPDRASPASVSTQPADDAALIARLRASDESAFAELFRSHTPPMYRVATALLGSDDAAADVVQSVMLRLWDQRDTITIRGAIGAYLRIATLNAARNAVRGATRARAAAERAANELAPMASAGIGTAPDVIDDDIPLDAQRAILLERAIAQLPDRTREIFLAWWGGELSYAEIAHAMGISVKGVERARARALETLRATLIDADLGPTAEERRSAR